MSAACRAGDDLVICTNWFSTGCAASFRSSVFLSGAECSPTLGNYLTTRHFNNIHFDSHRFHSILDSRAAETFYFWSAFNQWQSKFICKFFFKWVVSLGCHWSFSASCMQHRCYNPARWKKRGKANVYIYVYYCILELVFRECRRLTLSCCNSPQFHICPHKPQGSLGSHALLKECWQVSCLCPRKKRWWRHWNSSGLYHLALGLLWIWQLGEDMWSCASVCQPGWFFVHSASSPASLMWNNCQSSNFFRHLRRVVWDPSLELGHARHVSLAVDHW